MHSIVPLLKEVPLFEDFSVSELMSISPLFTERKIKKNTVLFHEGDLGNEFFIIETGVVKIYRIDYTKEVILSLLSEGDYFGEMSLIQQDMTRSATAETLANTTMYSLMRSDFIEFLEKSPKLCLKLLESTMERLRNANDQIANLTFLDVRTRTIKVIARLAEEHGIVRQGGVLINMKLTHQQLANLAGTVRESVTKVLQELQEDQIITIDKKMIYIRRMEALKERIV
ncbi:Crp/Fnr family transcriptional regulator [Paenibacillus vulneris]|uniref:Crp/Fnr family transcriptional regulator n=1 Tax=Paenibacillus vulneris TaxID=1133364 RepID=A0ABW3UK74_9BACL|nr:MULTISPECIES: Crp/Fnr family transcriptional regulator [unclassified Paenibacillus]MBE1443966.1 CRP/FNR family transcriptional regulator [Paenibacillus sp. OAS669]